MTELKYSRNTVGCRIGDDIFIHPDLYQYPELYHAVVEHEKHHSSGMKLKDVGLDLFNDDLKHVKKDFYKFILKHPRTLLGWFPITKIGKYWAFDLQLAVAWLLVIAFGWFIGTNL